MPINTYRCSGCGFEEEYVESISTSKELWHPEVCPNCLKEKLEKIFDMRNGKGGFDIVGFCYNNTYGKKNWKQNLSSENQIKVLTENKSPY